jgi:hypothetical protein
MPGRKKWARGLDNSGHIEALPTIDLEFTVDL